MASLLCAGMMSSTAGSRDKLLDVLYGIYRQDSQQVLSHPSHPFEPLACDLCITSGIPALNTWPAEPHMRATRNARCNFQMWVQVIKALIELKIIVPTADLFSIRRSMDYFLKTFQQATQREETIAVCSFVARAISIPLCCRLLYFAACCMLPDVDMPPRMSILPVPLVFHAFA